jgi:hypothetical protein
MPTSDQRANENTHRRVRMEVRESLLAGDPPRASYRAIHTISLSALRQRLRSSRRRDLWRTAAGDYTFRQNVANIATIRSTLSLDATWICRRRGGDRTHGST